MFSDTPLLHSFHLKQKYVKCKEIHLRKQPCVTSHACHASVTKSQQARNKEPWILNSDLSTKCHHSTNNSVKINVAWLTQLVERQFAVQAVEGSSSRLDQHSGSKITEENVLPFVKFYICKWAIPENICTYTANGF